MDDMIQNFYGAATAHIKNQEKALSAIRQFNMAMEAKSDGVQNRALILAAKNETLAFAA